MLLLIFTVAIFLSSALLFVIQPIFAKMVLPLLGGAPAIWITSILFFQAVLLAGYAYAHWAPERLGVRRHAIVHLGLLSLAAFTLPVGIPAGWIPDESRPELWLLSLLAVSLGLPFFMLSSSGPLLQRWFSATRHPAASDPYFLYRASNLGSMLALLSYPVLIEPLSKLPNQATFWSIGYGGLVLVAGACALLMSLNLATPIAPSLQEYVPSEERIAWNRRARWVILAFVPSSLMLGVTTFITTDIAAIPLFWVLPLSLYLLTFILVFGRRSLVPSRISLRIQPFVVVLIVLLLALRLNRTVALLPHLITVLAVGLVCHGLIAEDRPPARHLTEFYLWIAIGGVLGGFFNAVVAPAAFNGIVEYPLAIVIACLLRPNLGGGRKPWRLDVILPTGLFGLLVASQLVLDSWAVDPKFVKPAVFGAAALIAFSFGDRRIRFALGVAAILLAATIVPSGETSTVLYRSRTFFGSQKVFHSEDQQINRLVHGNTTHGAQSTLEEIRTEPLTYYHRDSPIGDVFGRLGGSFSKVGVIGLGTATLACYATDNQEWTYFEIDPEIERIARNPPLFTFLEECDPDARVVIGDARLSLTSMKSGEFDLLVIDAFNSDAIPLHLLTKEALDLYLDAVSANGVIAFHISNRYLDLKPVLAQLAREAHLAARVREQYSLTAEESKAGRAPSGWVVMARSPDALGDLAYDSLWQKPKTKPNVGLWTDDFSNLLTVLRW